MREDPIVAVAGLVVGLESQVPSIYRKQTPTLREKYKFTDEEVEFFDLHIVSDEIHGERGYQIVLEHADTVELQQRCLKICEVGAQMRLLYTTALYYDYVAKDIPLSETRTGREQGPGERTRVAAGLTRCRRHLHRSGQVYRGEVKENSNLVVKAGSSSFPFPTFGTVAGWGNAPNAPAGSSRGRASTGTQSGKKRKYWVPSWRKVIAWSASSGLVTTSSWCRTISPSSRWRPLA